jgi:hypothetical protein
MKDGKGILTKRAKYIAEMASLLAERAERYESVVDDQYGGNPCGMYGYEFKQTDCGTNIERMIVQMRAELLEMGRMLSHD